jgi:hypothetical protein
MSAIEPLPITPSRRPWMEALTEPASLISALKWGAITGVAYYIVSLLVVFVELALLQGTGNPAANLVFALPQCVGIFALGFGLYAAGYQAGSERMHVAPGVLASVIMALLSSVLSRIYTPGLSGTAPKQPASNIGVMIVAFALDLAFVIGFGYMGGFYGIKNKLKAKTVKGE